MSTSIMKKSRLIQHSWSCRIPPMMLRQWKRRNSSSYLTYCLRSVESHINAVRFYLFSLIHSFIYFVVLQFENKASCLVDKYSTIQLHLWPFNLIQRPAKLSKLALQVFYSPDRHWIWSLSDQAFPGATGTDTHCTDLSTEACIWPFKTWSA